ncbi:MAG: 4-(cytidine 5'-diphospho)-2-C-methyl-D-erythritol kinase [Deltaproteobacteria bacterium]|nr:4-(cytidine 5'-diphospho)-2-C-methyl-D-erythritol kinase [Deltaproteobacteria bacterium]MBW2307115.1 4-(cytidine 5'-diphospho)-2-C-methyl-D-erythritol kinase [Deltaproteobacteria bacterium]
MSPPQSSIVVWPPAKINLRLEVLGRRPDGYHDILSIMQQVDLCDRIEIHPADKGIHVHCEGADLPEGEGNLVYEAARLLAEKTPKACGVAIHLQKRIPLAAGLGGGSSDAAAVLKILNKLWDIELPPAELMRLGLSLGADVPFFLFGSEAVARGVGEVLRPLPAQLPSWTYVLVDPGFPVSAAWAYQSLKMELTQPKTGINIKKIFDIIFPVKHWLINDLEAAVILKYPVIQIIKETLLQLGAEGTLMSGSGPTVFGVFASRAGALRAAEAIRGNQQWDVFVARRWSGDR